MAKQDLPIDPILPEIVARLRQGQNLVLEAPPGAGKTTRVPAALLDAGLSRDREVWVLEPRRLAARMAARHVAEERGELPGETVGYQVRFEDVAGPRTRLRFVTEGILTRRLISDPNLDRVGIVVLDEFHERHLTADLGLALLRRLQKGGRPDLKLIVMSATLDAAPVAGFLGDCPVSRSEGKRFEIEIEHLARPDERPLADQVASALKKIIDEGLDGDVLVFLPGAAEIRRAQQACARIADKNDLLVLPLHGDLPAAEQDRAVSPAARRKVILSTNVAESSITIDGIVAVIDSGLARVAGHSPWSGLPALNVGRISKASAAQRAGRAGRTRPGRCLRLFTAQDFNARLEHDPAEISRLDLAEPALELHAAGIADLSAFEWFEPPPPESARAAENLLQKLDAIDSEGHLTATGRSMLEFPLHPRQSRLLVEASRRGALEQAMTIVALIGERDIVSSELFGSEGRGSRREISFRSGPSDLLERLDLFEEAFESGFAVDKCRKLGLDPAAVRVVSRIRKQLEQISRKKRPRPPLPPPVAAEADPLLISVLTGYPDRVARRRNVKSDNPEILLSTGGTAALSEYSVVRGAEFLVAVDIEQRRTVGLDKKSGTIVRLASEIDPSWLLDLYPGNLREQIEAQWNAQSERVETRSLLLYDQLVISESVEQGSAGEQVAEVLSSAALTAGWEKFADPDEVRRFLARVEFVARQFPEASLPELTEDDVRRSLAEFCRGRRSFAELHEAAGHRGLIENLRHKMPDKMLRFLDQMAPEYVAIRGRRQVKVQYEQGRSPWIASRLQDFFGMKEGPAIAGGRIHLVLHLLAPNQRPVQMTSDLAGFWQRLYPQVRRELSRRYPRHRWPENPMIIDN